MSAACSLPVTTQPPPKTRVCGCQQALRWPRGLFTVLVLSQSEPFENHCESWENFKGNFSKAQLMPHGSQGIAFRPGFRGLAQTRPSASLPAGRHSFSQHLSGLCGQVPRGPSAPLQGELLPVCPARASSTAGNFSSHASQLGIDGALTKVATSDHQLARRQRGEHCLVLTDWPQMVLGPRLVT